MDHFDVLIAGGGYGGLMCALRLAARLRNTGRRIGLINPVAGFVERLRMHEGLAGEPVKQRELDLPTFLKGAGVEFICGTVAEIDRTARRLAIEYGGESRAVGYDRLVIAVGSANRFDAVPGARETAFFLEPHSDQGGAHALKAAAGSARRILVVGGGATGIEAAGELARLNGTSVTLVTSGAFGGFTTTRVAAALRRAIASAGVSVVENVEVTALDRGCATTSNGPMPFDLAVVAAGFVVPDFVSRSGLAVSADGRVLVDPWLRSVADGRIFAVGDAALPVEPCEAPPRMSVFYALATGAHVADTIADTLAGRRLRRFGFWTYGQAIAVGRSAVGFATIPFDRPIGPLYTGRTGYWIRHFFVWLLFMLLKIERRWPSLPFYLGRPRLRDGTP